MSHRCCKRTASRQPCTLEADRERNGRWYCHVHDPQGKAAQNRAQQHPSARPAVQAGAPKSIRHVDRVVHAGDGSEESPF